ncbi:MAG: hypothetical protein IJM94_03430, partial [Clostridia bacterium]|nr:hypothetical protein [Clostridia bacterium]
NGTETVKNKPGIAPVSVPWQNNTYAFDLLGDVNKKYFTSKADDYKDNQYKEDHQKSKAETKALQETLNKNGYTDSNNKPLVVDGIFGPNTEYAYNNAVKNNWKNLSSQFDIERDEISSAVDKAYASIIEKADNRKLSMSPDEIKQVQQFLNDQGYTDLQGKTLVVDGILGDRTKYAFEKYIQEDTPKTEVIELQKKLNELGITDSDQNPLVIDGKLGKKTDSAVKNAVTKYGKTADKNSKQGEKKNNKTLDKVSNFLVWASLIPGLDTLSNLAAIPVDLLRGDYVSAALSAAAMLPYVGEAADAAKLARVADKTVDVAKVVGKAGKTADAINSADTIIDTFNAAKKITNAADVTDDIGDTLKVLEKGTDAGKVAGKTIDAGKIASRSAKGEELLDLVSNSKLKNTIKEMYRPGAKVGDGGLADAIRHEIKTGSFVGGKSHIQKGSERLRNLEKILKKETLTEQEREIVESLIEDLKRALGGE